MFMARKVVVNEPGQETGMGGNGMDYGRVSGQNWIPRAPYANNAALRSQTST